MRKLTLAAALAAATISTAAFASVTFDSTTGTGFVGKGDVQIPFGWNNAQLQRNAAGVTFTYNTTDTYEAVCTFTTGEGTRGERIHNLNHNTSSAVLSSVAFEARKNSNGAQGPITGFFLTGLGAVTSSGDAVPVVGGPCMGNEGHGGLWSSVTATGSSGGLYVNYGGNSILLPPTPTV
jgi:hypothetical protein